MSLHVLSLIMVVSALFSLAPGFPGPACNSEWPNAQYNAWHLKSCMEHLHKLFLEGGYEDGEKRTHTCLPRGSEVSDGTMQLDTISTRLCQYNACLTHLANSSWGTNYLPHSIIDKIGQCQGKLSHLRNTITKMKPLTAPKQSLCEVAWPFAGMEWKEITIGPQLSKELLDYLKQLQFPCG